MPTQPASPANVAYKCTNGIKRHLAVDTLGFPYFTHCTAANVSDDQGLIEMLTNNLDYFRAKPVNIPKITILLDHGYHPAKLTLALQAVYPQIMTKSRCKLAPKPTPAIKLATGKAGVVPVATRWVIERTNAWMERCKSGCNRAEVSSACVAPSSLVRNFDRTLERSNAKLKLCSIPVMVNPTTNPNVTQ